MARKFNGTSDRIRADAAHLFVVASAYSVALWVKYASPATNKCVFSESNTGVSSGNFFLVGTSLTTASLVNIRIASGTVTLLDIDGTGTAFDSTWRHIAYSQDASRNYKLYTNGTVDKSGTVTSGSFTVNDLCIGALARSTVTNFYGGSIADVATWGRQLTDAEVSHMASGGSPAELGPAHYWPLWGADSPEPDIGNG